LIITKMHGQQHIKNPIYIKFQISTTIIPQGKLTSDFEIKQCI